MFTSETKNQKIMKFRNICFTLNNYTEEEYQRIQQIDIEKEKIRYIVVGKEVGELGTPHLQGYIEYNTQVRMAGIKKLISNRLHIEERKGTAQQALVYCKKDENYIEKGQPKLVKDKKLNKVGEQGKRQDILNIWDSVKKGYSQTQLLEEYPIEYSKYGKAIDKYYTINEPPRDRNQETQIYWYYGSTGVGKSKAVYDENEEVFTPKNYKWWDGYDRHKVVLLDDVRADYCKFHEWLTLTDRYQYKVEVKGGMRQLVAEKIYITAPCHPKDMFKNKTDEDIGQLLRRITVIKNFDEDVEDENQGIEIQIKNKKVKRYKPHKQIKQKSILLTREQIQVSNTDEYIKKYYGEAQLYKSRLMRKQKEERKLEKNELKKYVLTKEDIETIDKLFETSSLDYTKTDWDNYHHLNPIGQKELKDRHEKFMKE